ncbi:MAG: sugar transferase [Acidimicrobiia bacterium]
MADRIELALRRMPEVDAPSPEAHAPFVPSHNGQVIDLTDGATLLRLSSNAALLNAPKWKMAVKRAVDVVGASLALVLLSPVFLLSAIAVKLTSPGPVFFAQPRMGKDGREFLFYKFRSMQVGADEERNILIDLNEMSGPVFKIKADPRLTSIGRFLRRASIDELPQLWHVLRGQMSLVGPRPLPTFEALDCSEWEAQRFAVKPGITCIWQVSGRSELDFETWVRMDIRYIERWSLLRDFKLLAKTIPAVISGKGAY